MFNGKSFSGTKKRLPIYLALYEVLFIQTAVRENMEIYNQAGMCLMMIFFQSMLLASEKMLLPRLQNKYCRMNERVSLSKKQQWQIWSSYLKISEKNFEKTVENLVSTAK